MMSGLQRAIVLLSTLLVGGLACGPTAIQDESAEEERGPGPDVRLPPSDPIEYDCADISEEGVCKDGNAFFCDKRSELIEVKRCASRGLSCDDSGQGARCVNEVGIEEEVDTEVEGGGSSYDTGQDCGDHDYAGSCEGNTLHFCTPHGTLYVHDCSDVGAVCGFSQPSGYYGCLPPTQCDPNADRCAGNAIQICTLGASGWEVERWDCDADETCVEDGSSASCEPRTMTGAEPTCEEIGVKGACIDASGNVSAYQEDKLAYCAADGVTVVVEDCSFLGLKCIDPDSSGYVECGTP